MLQSPNSCRLHGSEIGVVEKIRKLDQIVSLACFMFAKQQWSPENMPNFISSESCFNLLSAHTQYHSHDVKSITLITKFAKHNNIKSDQL